MATKKASRKNEQPDAYQSDEALLSGTSQSEVMSSARAVYRTIQRRTRRTPYVRSTYFQKQKIFLTIFWMHIDQKNWRDRVRRLKLYACAIDTLRHTTLAPISVQNPNAPDELLHRFKGKSLEGAVFTVQVKENKRTGRKDFLSVFPD